VTYCEIVKRFSFSLSEKKKCTNTDTEAGTKSGLVSPYWYKCIAVLSALALGGVFSAIIVCAFDDRCGSYHRGWWSFVEIERRFTVRSAPRRSVFCVALGRVAVASDERRGTRAERPAEKDCVVRVMRLFQSRNGRFWFELSESCPPPACCKKVPRYRAVSSVCLRPIRPCPWL